MHVSVLGDPGDPVVVTVRGHLDLDSAPVLTTALDQVLDGPAPHVVVDLSGVEFCDSTGLSAFVIGHNRAHDAGGWVRLCRPQPLVARVLEITNLTSVLPVFDSIDGAVSASDPPGSDDHSSSDRHEGDPDR